MMDTIELAADLAAMSRQITGAAMMADTRAAELQGWADRLRAGLSQMPSQVWRSPVGNEAHPPSDWYTYITHDLTGRLNPGGYRHTGLDFNGNWRKDGKFRGDVDIGEPVFCVADAEVVDVGWSESFRAGIVLKVDHFGTSLWVRYWHLQKPVLDFQVGQRVAQGQLIGLIDKYPKDFAHCHWDTAYHEIKHNWWWTYHKDVAWANSLQILRMHLDHALVDSMTGRG